MPEAAERLWTSADGLSLFARDYAGAAGSERLPVICLHGLTRNSRDFETVAPHIARTTGRRVLAPDMRGRGRSAYDPNPLNYIPLVYAGDVITLMDHLGLARAAFIGTSLGGLVTMTLAAMRPDLVAGAVLNDIGPELPRGGMARIGGYVGRPAPVTNWAEAAAYARDINPPVLPHVRDWDAFARRLFREDEGGRPVLDYDLEIAWGFKSAKPTDPPTADLWPLFSGLAKDRPLLLVRGAASDLIDDEIAARMAAAAPSMRQVILPGVGHAPTLEEPEAMAAIEALLAEVP